MQLFPGNGGGSDLGKLLTVAALGAGAYYGLGGLASAGAGAGAAGAVTAADFGGFYPSFAGTSVVPLAGYPALGVGAGLSTSVLKGIKDAAPLAAVGLASGALTPRMPGFPNIPAIPARADEAVSEARRKQMELDKLSRGRSASILTGSRGIEGGLGSVSRPAARAAQLLGD